MQARFRGLNLLEFQTYFIKKLRLIDNCIKMGFDFNDCFRIK
jgi:hypothetical protein